MLTHSLLALHRRYLSRPEGNAWLEVFAIHSRNLNEFYSNKKLEKAYMRPSDFITWQYSYSLIRFLRVALALRLRISPTIAQGQDNGHRGRLNCSLSHSETHHCIFSRKHLGSSR